MDLKSQVKAKRADILRVVSEFGGNNIRLFGSVARGEAGENSDIDLLIDMAVAKNIRRMPNNEGKKKEMQLLQFRVANMAGDLERILQRKVHISVEELLRPNQRRCIVEEAERQLVHLGFQCSGKSEQSIHGNIYVSAFDFAKRNLALNSAFSAIIAFPD